MSPLNGKFALFHVTAGSTKPDDFFLHFFKEHESELIGCGPVQHYPPAAELFHGNAPVEVVYLIERGIVKLSKEPTPQGAGHLVHSMETCRAGRGYANDLGG